MPRLSRAERDRGYHRASVLFALEPCERCGASPHAAGIDRHHRDRNPLNNEPDNVTFLCRACHRALHAALVTHCRRGHPFDAANTGLRGDGRRVCRACVRESTRRYRARRRARREAEASAAGRVIPRRVGTKLTPEKAAAIRAAVGVPGGVLAGRFGVSPQLVSDIRAGRRWSEHLRRALALAEDDR